MKIAAVIFDMDGLMLDTEPIYRIAWQSAASEAGYDLDDARYERLVGRRTEECERILLDDYGSSFPLEAFRQRWPELWRREVERLGIRTKPGLLEVISFVEAQSLPMAVATSRGIVFTGATGSVLVALAVFGIRAQWTGWPAVGLALFVSGGASNWIDRVARGSVVDFLNVGVGPLRTGIFNVADVALMLGAVLIVAGDYLERRAEQARAA